jgi:predicted O-linked N-acetylglucosamine transferase (SPINDLY family)
MVQSHPTGQVAEPWQHHWQQALQAHQRHQLPQAIIHYHKVVEHNPQFADAHANLAMALAASNRLQEADQAFRQALSLQSDHALNHSNYGFFLNCHKRYSEAEQHLRRAVQLNPQLGIAWTNLGNVLRSLDRWEEAVSCYQTAWPLSSNHWDTLSDWLFGLKKLCRWAAQEPVALTLMQASEHLLFQGKQSPINPFLACLMPLTPAQFLRICASHATALEQQIQQQGLDRRFPRHQQSTTPAQSVQRLAQTHDPSSSNTKRIKLGYVCAALGRHPTGHLIEGMFERHDRDRFEVYGYATQPHDGSSYRDRIGATIEHFREVHSYRDPELADAIFQDQIDILIDLDGYTTNHRQGIFALRPAPIQVTWLGFPGTTGASYMDYLIADAIVVPAGHEPFYTENIIRLPITYQVTNHRQLPTCPILNPSQRRTARQAAQLPPDATVFCSFNNNTKIDAATFQAWLQILKGVPDSVLWILIDTPEAVINLRRSAQQAHIDPARIAPVQRLSDPFQHIARMQLADLYLDCLIYNAHTTASDALWAGVPVLTCPGETFASRVGASLVQAAGLPQLICNSEQQFVTQAIELAQKPQQLRAYQDYLHTHKATLPLFDTDGFVRHLETALTQIYDRKIEEKTIP